MGYTNYRDMETAIECLLPFEGNSARGEYSRLSGNYIIYSYATPILRVSADGSRIIYWNPRRYSMTTSRLQNIIRRIYGAMLETAEEVAR